MKKIIIILLCSCLCLPIFTQNTQAKNREINILLHIENAQDMYLLSMQDDCMKVKVISNKMVLPLSCLDNEPTTLKSVNFTSAQDCLLSSLNTSLHQTIQYYTYIKMDTLLQRLDIPKKAYDYQSLDSLCEVGNKIKKKIRPALLLEYHKYLDTNLNLETLYTLYRFFTQDKIKIQYYTLSYFVIEQKYIPMSTTFHLKKKVK